MKIKNKKWMALVEAVLAMTIMIFIVWFIAYIIADTKKNGNRNDELLTMMHVESFKNNLIFLKSRLISKWKIISQTDNNLFYGWDKLKITTTQTFNELDWVYKLSNWICDTWIWKCLEKITTWDFVSIPLWGNTIKYNEDFFWRLITNSTLVANTSIDCSESWPNCLDYRIIIKNQPTWNYIPLSYTTPSWAVKTLNDRKIVTIEVKKGDRTEIQKFNYLLSIY